MDVKAYTDRAYLEMAAGILAPIKHRSYGRMQLKEGHRVLDVGCGPGTDTFALAEAVGATGQVVGIDIDEEMVTEANRRTESSARRAAMRHQVAEANSLPFEAETFDAARSERLFQHLQNPAGALAEMIRVVKTSAWIVVIDTDWATLSFDSLEPEIERKLLPFHARTTMRNGYAGRQLYRLFREQGLVEVSIEVFPQSMTDCALARRSIGLAIAEKRALEAGVLTAGELARWNACLDRASAQENFFGSWNMLLVAGRK